MSTQKGGMPRGLKSYLGYVLLVVTVVAAICIVTCLVNAFTAPQGSVEPQIASQSASASSATSEQPQSSSASSASSSAEGASSGASSTSSVPAGSDNVREVDGNVPSFTQREIDNTPVGYEYYPDLDSLGRCGACTALIGRETMPDAGEKRGSISGVKPSGWKNAKYEFVDGLYLYNRCHLIGWQLSAENANERNLVTGTRYLNVEEMLPYENRVAEHVRVTGNHVLYRVTPVFEGDELVCRGVEMEALSVEDGGAGLSFHVYCANVQPGVTIDYSSGDNHADGTI